MKKWGKIKISYALKLKKLSSYCIDKALGEISDEDYEAQVADLIDKKYSQLHGEEYIVKNKIVNYLAGKGYELDLAWKILDDFLQNRK